MWRVKPLQSKPAVGVVCRRGGSGTPRKFIAATTMSEACRASARRPSCHCGGRDVAAARRCSRRARHAAIGSKLGSSASTADVAVRQGAGRARCAAPAPMAGERARRAHRRSIGEGMLAPASSTCRNVQVLTASWRAVTSSDRRRDCARPADTRGRSARACARSTRRQRPTASMRFEHGDTPMTATPTSTAARSSDRDGFWAEQAALIDWQRPFEQVCDYSNPPFARWFVGGHDQPVPQRGRPPPRARARDQNALIYVSTETDEERVYSFRELHAEVQRMAAMLQALGVQAGRPGADLHADDSRGGVRDAGLRAHRRDPLGGVRRLRQRQPGQPHRRRAADGHRQRRRRQPRRQGRAPTSRCSTKRSGWPRTSRRRCCWSTAAWRRWSACPGATTTTRRCASSTSTRRCRAPGSTSTHPSYTLYTSGTTGKPKGVQRDTGGYAVALAASMKHIFRGRAGRDLLLHQRHRLGRRPQLHRLRPADRRHGDHHVRGLADPARRRHLVEPGREVQGHARCSARRPRCAC